MNTRILCSTNNMTKQEWLKMRKLGIGGSDVGAICGVNTWKGPISVYLEKTATNEPEVNAELEEYEQNELMYWGNKQEETVSKEFLLREGKSVQGLKIKKQNKMFQHRQYDFMLANIDRLIYRPDMGYGILECKTASEYAKQEWEGDLIPGSYYLQVQHYLAVMDLQYAYIAVLIGGNKFKYKFILRDDELIENIIKIESSFWNENVLKCVTPALDGSEDAADMLIEMYPESELLKVIELNDMADKISKILEIDRKIKNLEIEKEKYKQEIQEKMGTAEKALIDVNGKVISVTWKTQVSNRIDSKLLKAEQPDIYNKYTKPSPSRPFKITG